MDSLQNLVLSRLLISLSEHDLEALMSHLDKDTLLTLFRCVRDKLEQLPKERVCLVLKKSFRDVILTEQAKERLKDYGYTEEELIWPLSFRYEQRFIRVLEELEDMFSSGDLEIANVDLAVGQYIDIVEIDDVEYAFPVWI